MQQRIKNSPKERKKNRQREYSPICVGKIYIVWKKEKQIFYNKKKMGRRRVKIKGT